MSARPTIEVLNAGVDLLLVAFDGSQFNRIFACAYAALTRQDLVMAMLHDSETRLTVRLFRID